LGVEGISLFKDIFQNNNKKSIEAFYGHPFIRRLWPTIALNLTYQHCFESGAPNPQIMTTYSKITENMKTKYGLEMPTFWK